MRIGQFGCMLQTNASYWSTLSETPIWISIKDATPPSWAYSAVARKRLAALEYDTPPRLLRDGDALLVPLFMPLATEREGVLIALRKQMGDLLALLLE